MIDACHKFLKQWMMFDSRFWDSYYRQHWILRWGVIIMPQVTQCSLFYGIYEGKWKLRENWENWLRWIWYKIWKWLKMIRQSLI
jgi:hypothetical protein